MNKGDRFEMFHLHRLGCSEVEVLDAHIVTPRIQSWARVRNKHGREFMLWGTSAGGLRQRFDPRLWSFKDDADYWIISENNGAVTAVELRPIKPSKQQAIRAATKTARRQR